MVPFNTVNLSKSIAIRNGEISVPSQPAFTCSKLTIETVEQGVKYVQS